MEIPTFVSSLIISLPASHPVVMGDDTESYKVAYFWKCCDHLMGFKEFMDIRRTETKIVLENFNQGDVFERKIIGSHGDGIVFQKRNVDI